MSVVNVGAKINVIYLKTFIFIVHDFPHDKTNIKLCESVRLSPKA